MRYKKGDISIRYVHVERSISFSCNESFREVK
jgi:hypothetical protein